MSIVTIEDLPESVDLDRQAMLAISGGARTRGRPALPGRTLFRSARIVDRIVDYPAGFAGKPPPGAGGQAAGSPARK